MFKFKNISQCLVSITKKYPDKVAVTDLDKSYTWKDINFLTELATRHIYEKGIRKGNYVALWVNNSVSWIVLFLALQRIGAITVLLNTAYKWRELEAALENCDVEYIFYSKSFKDSDHQRTINQLNIDKLPYFKEAYLVPDEPMSLPDGKYKSNLSIYESEYDPDIVSNILFTSGTTGVARGAMLTHRNLICNSKAIVERLQWTSEDKICLSVPMYHCFGITVGILGALHTGASLHIMRKFSSELAFKTIEEHKCTIFNGVPTMFLAMKNSSKRFNYNLTSFKGGLVAGSSIIPEEFKAICEEFNLDRLNTAFGQTESSPAITVSSDNDSLEKRANTSGKPLADVEVRIVADGKVVAANVEGEIQTRGYHVMAGYYKMLEETEKAIDKDGWLSTGDLGCIDEEGYLHVTGRIKDIIVRGGENISPVEIERVICQIPGVASVKVVGVKAAVIQEEVVACIIWKKGENMPEEEVKKIISANLADYKVPRYILDYEKFPMNSSGKVLSKELSELSYQRIYNKKENIY